MFRRQVREGEAKNCVHVRANEEREGEEPKSEREKEGAKVPPVSIGRSAKGVGVLRSHSLSPPILFFLSEKRPKKNHNNNKITVDRKKRVCFLFCSDGDCGEIEECVKVFLVFC